MTENFEITKDVLEKLQKVELRSIEFAEKIISIIQSCTERF